MGLVGTNYCATVVTVCYSGCQATCSHTPSYIAGLEEKKREHPGLNQGPLDLQSNALPLSYAPSTLTLGLQSIS